MIRITLLIILFNLFSSFTFTQSVEKGFFLYQGLAGLDYPMGIQSDTAVYYRIPTGESEEMLFKTAHTDIGIENWLTPTDNFLALYCKLEPIAFFDLVFRSGYDGIFNFTGVGFQPVSGPGEPYDSESAVKLPMKTGPDYGE